MRGLEAMTRMLLPATRTRSSNFGSCSTRVKSRASNTGEQWASPVCQAPSPKSSMSSQLSLPRARRIFCRNQSSSRAYAAPSITSTGTWPQSGHRQVRLPRPSLQTCARCCKQWGQSTSTGREPEDERSVRLAGQPLGMCSILPFCLS